MTFIFYWIKINKKPHYAFTIVHVTLQSCYYLIRSIIILFRNSAFLLYQGGIIDWMERLVRVATYPSTAWCHCWERKPTSVRWACKHPTLTESWTPATRNWTTSCTICGTCLTASNWPRRASWRKLLRSMDLRPIHRSFYNGLNRGIGLGLFHHCPELEQTWTF